MYTKDETERNGVFFVNEFKTYHPIVSFIYFLLTISFSMLLMHPVCLCISLFCAVTYATLLKGRKAAKGFFCGMLPLMLITALINPAFNHAGVTVLKYLPSGNPLTLEAGIYGLCAAFMLAAVICWFLCFNEIMTSDKIICLFGRVIPSLSLIFSMTLRFVPRFSAQLKAVANAQRTMGRSPSSGGIIRRAKNGLSILSAAVTWALENSVETADSMKARGYGLKGRTAFSVFMFDTRDKKALVAILSLGVYVLTGMLTGQLRFDFFPFISGAEVSAYGISVFVAYLLLCGCPIIIELWEAKKWKAIKSKI